MNASLDNLRHGLAELADDVRPIDLRDRTLKTSKRLGYQRAAVTSTLAVALVAGAAGVALAVLPGRGTSPVPPAVSPSISPSATSSPSASATPSAMPSATVSVAPPNPTPIGNAVQPLPGTFVFFQVYDDGHVDLFTLTGGWARKVGTVPAHADSCAFNSVTVSRDGTKVAWVRTGGGLIHGELMVADIGGTNAKLLLSDVSCAGGSGPVWSADGRSLSVYNDVTSSGGLVDVATGKFTKAVRSPYQVLSANGLFGANFDGRHLTVSRVDGSGTKTVSYTPAIAPDMDTPALGISPDGRYVTIGIGKGDPGRVLSVQAVVDMTTGKAIPLPSPDIRQAYFLADGSMMLATNTSTTTVIYQMSADHKVVAQVTVPNPLKGIGMLQYNS